MDTSLKQRITLVIVGCAVCLIAAFAYNLGGIAVGEAMQRDLARSLEDLRTTEQQYGSCSETLRSLKGKRVTIEADMRAEMQSIAAAIATQKDKHDSIEQELMECSDSLKEKKDSHNQEHESAAVLQKLKQENKQLELWLVTANDTLKEYHQHLRLRVRALRLEYNELHTMLTKRQAELRATRAEERRVEAQQEALQEKDIGVGEKRKHSLLQGSTITREDRLLEKMERKLEQADHDEAAKNRLQARSEMEDPDAVESARTKRKARKVGGDQTRLYNRRKRREADD